MASLTAGLAVTGCFSGACGPDGDQIKDALRQRLKQKRLIHPAQVPPNPILGVWAQTWVCGAGASSAARLPHLGTGQGCAVILVGARHVSRLPAVRSEPTGAPVIGSGFAQAKACEDGWPRTPLCG